MVEPQSTDEVTPRPNARKVREGVVVSAKITSRIGRSAMRFSSSGVRRRRSASTMWRESFS